MLHKLVSLLLVAWNRLNLFEEIEAVLNDVRLFLDRLCDITNPFEEFN